MTLLSYEECREIIAVHTPENAFRFADGWERFPVSENAIIIAQALGAAAQYYKQRKPNTYDLIMRATRTISERAEY